MDPKKLVHDASKVHACLKELESGQVVALKECKIYIPSRFTERGLATVSTEVSISGIYAIVVEDRYYGVSDANAMMRIEPTMTNYVTIGDDEYIEFVFEPGATVISSVDLVKADLFIYQIYSELIASGNVPWFYSYKDMGHIFDSAPYHAGVRVGANHAIIEMIVASISRDPTDRTKYYRHTIKTMEDIYKNPPAYIPLRNVSYGASNATAKLVGAYWEEGLTSALVNPTDTVEPIEGLLRR